jgi:hypothetical protein
MKKYLSIILLFISMKSFACDCGIKKLSEWQKSEIENSECIFVGEVIEINKTDLTFKIKVTESLDGGDAIGNIYIGKNWAYCSPYVEKKGTWIVYGQMEDGFLRLNMCGISRSFDNPVVSPFILPSSESEKAKSEIIKVALSELELEITALRKRRDEE